MVQITMLIFNISLLISKNAIEGAQRKVFPGKNLGGNLRRGNLRWASRNFRDYGMPAYASWGPRDRGVGPSQKINVVTPPPERQRHGKSDFEIVSFSKCLF